MEVLVEDLVRWCCTRTCTTRLAMLLLSSWPPPLRTLPLAPSCIEVDPHAMSIWLLRKKEHIFLVCNPQSKKSPGRYLTQQFVGLILPRIHGPRRCRPSSLTQQLLTKGLTCSFTSS